MASQNTIINTPGSNTWTAPATLVGGSISVIIFGAIGDGQTLPYSGPANWDSLYGARVTTGGKSGRIDATVTASPNQTFTCWVGNAGTTPGHGYHVGGLGGVGGGGGQFGFAGGGSSALLTGATPVLLLEAAGGGGAGGNAYTNFGGAHGGYGGKKFGAGYNGGVTSHTPQCFGGGGAGGGGHQGVGSGAIATHTGYGGTIAGEGGDSGINRAGTAGGGGGAAGGTSYAATSGVISATFTDAGGGTTLGSLNITAKVADAPSAPTLIGPYNGIYVDCTKALTLYWAYNAQPDSGTQQSYALRIAIDGGAYQYWNATTQTFGATEVWNAESTIGGLQPQATIPANTIPNGHTITWSVATAESHYGLQGPFSANFSFLSGTTVKWQLVDPVTAEAYAFQINPNTGGSLSRQKNVTSYATTADDSQIVLYEGSDTPQQVSVSGTLLSQAQYSSMIYWYSKRRQVLLIDDLGRNIWVYFTQWTPTRKWTVQSPWRHDWSAQFFVIGPQAVTAR